MFLHLGADVTVPKSDIVAILDVQTGVVSATRDYLNMARNQGLLQMITDADKVRSYVVTIDKVYLSPISCGTLKKRTLAADPGLNTP